jgi:hypothetical protein
VIVRRGRLAASWSVTPSSIAAVSLEHHEPARLAMRALIVVAFVLISSTCFAATSERYGKGGWYKDFQPEIERANSSGELFRIKGHC